MMGKRSVVSTQILAEQPKAMATHSQGHSLSLAIKSITKDCTILRDVMGNVGEICVLVKYSFKREKMLGVPWKTWSENLRNHQGPITKSLINFA